MIISKLQKGPQKLMFYSNDIPNMHGTETTVFFQYLKSTACKIKIRDVGLTETPQMS